MQPPAAVLSQGLLIRCSLTTVRYCPRIVRPQMAGLLRIHQSVIEHEVPGEFVQAALRRSGNIPRSLVCSGIQIVVESY